MINNGAKLKYDPLNLYLNLARVFCLFLLFLYWLSASGEPLGMVLLLGISVFSILRQHFPSRGVVVALEGLFVGGLSFFSPEFSIAYSIPVFEGSFEKKPAWILPGLLLGIFGWHLNSTLILLFLLGGFLGFFLRIANNERDYYKEESDTERRGRYEAESLNRELLSLQEEVLRMAELSERNRIAQQLHDDVGHELTGAVLGLQAFESMIEEKELDHYESEIFDKAKERVYKSATVLRQTVHNMKPYIPLGVDDLRGIVEEFSGLSIDLKVFGNTDQVPVHYWVLLKTALKEGLTNIMRHAKAARVKVQLDVTPSILRFNLENDGVKNQTSVMYEGIGLRSLRQRTKSYRGSFSATIMTEKNLFRLVIVLPLTVEEYHEPN